MRQDNFSARRLISNRNNFLLGWSTLVVFQSIIGSDWVNLGAGLLAIVGGVFGTVAFFRMDVLRAYPVSTFMLLGFTTYYFLLPPIATLIEGKQLTNNLIHPILVYIHALICLFCLCGAHIIYRSSQFLQAVRQAVSEKLHRPLGFFRAPSNEHLFAMGIVGTIAMASQVFIAGSVQAEAMGAGNKFIQALFPLAYLPYCLFVRRIMGVGVSHSLNKKWLWLLLAYTTLLFLLSMARNSRSVLFMGVASIAFVYFYGLSTGLFSTRILRARNIIITILTVWGISGPLADLAVSMQIVRGQRTDISPMQLVSETLSVFGDKEAIKYYRKMETLADPDWDEMYVDNPFLSRLANLKFADQGVHLSSLLDENGSFLLRDLEWQKALAVLPRPLIELIGLNVDKDTVSSASGGDLMLYVATGSPWALGGFRTGSLFGSGYGMFGWYYPIVLSVLSFFIFTLADAQTSRALVKSLHGNFDLSPVFGPMTMVTFFTWFFYLTSAASGLESMAALSQFIFRGWIQVLLIYAIVYRVTYLLIGPFTSRSPSHRVNYCKHLSLAKKRESSKAEGINETAFSYYPEK